MLFNSFNFFVIFPFIFAIYWVIPSKWHPFRKWWLILVSYLLYMNWNPAYALVLLFITIITYTGGLLFGRHLEESKGTRKRRLCYLLASLALLPLLIFKYYNFISEAGFQLLEMGGLHFSLPGLNWAIPVGISFYTFQALGYMLDVYYGKIQSERNFTDYVLFCSFFPQTASGPISRASELLPQIKKHNSFSYEQAREGLQLLLWGLFLKVVMADRLGIYVDTVYNNYIHYDGITCFIASVFYTIQIYGDFAGYSLMAVGIGKTLGFDLVNNFNRPYLATSITEFWRRWHISLTRWLTAYVYIPLGGSRCSKLRHYWNIMVTFLVSGLWHGANWTFVVWGMLHGLFQIVEKMLGLDPKGKYGNTPVWMKPFRIAVTFLLVNFAWILFRSVTINDAYSFIVKILTMEDGVNEKIQFVPVLILVGLLLIGRECIEEYFFGKLSVFNNNHYIVRWGGYLFLISLILLYGVLDSTQFIYVSF